MDQDAWNVKWILFNSMKGNDVKNSKELETRFNQIIANENKRIGMFLEDYMQFILPKPLITLCCEYVLRLPICLDLLCYTSMWPEVLNLFNGNSLGENLERFRTIQNHCLGLGYCWLGAFIELKLINSQYTIWIYKQQIGATCYDVYLCLNGEPLTKIAMQQLPSNFFCDFTRQYKLAFS